MTFFCGTCPQGTAAVTARHCGKCRKTLWRTPARRLQQLAPCVDPSVAQPGPSACPLSSCPAPHLQPCRPQAAPPFPTCRARPTSQPSVSWLRLRSMQFAAAAVCCGCLQGRLRPCLCLERPPTSRLLMLTPAEHRQLPACSRLSLCTHLTRPCTLPHVTPPAGFDPSRTTVDIGILVAFYFLMVMLALGLFFLRLPRQRGASGGGRARAFASRTTSAFTTAVDAMRSTSGRLLQRGGSTRPEAVGVPVGAPGMPPLPPNGSKRFTQPAPRGVEAAANGTQELPKAKAVASQLPETPSTAELLPASATTTTSGAEVAVAADAASAPVANGIPRLDG